MHDIFSKEFLVPSLHARGSFGYIEILKGDFPILFIMVELTGEGRACIPASLKKT